MKWYDVRYKVDSYGLEDEFILTQTPTSP